MFHPNRITLLAWTSESVPGTVRPHSNRNQPQPIGEPQGADAPGSVRRLALTTGFAILLLVFALMVLATETSARAHAVVAAPPVFCNAMQVLSTGEADFALLHEPNRSWMTCVQPHSQIIDTGLADRWVHLWDRTSAQLVGLPRPTWLRSLKENDS